MVENSAIQWSTARKRLAWILFIVVAVVSLVFKLYISQLGYNPDSESWWLVKEAVVRGDSVYVSTHRYNYGPIWSYVLAIIGHLTDNTALESIQGLHYFVAWFLGLVDIAIALVLVSSFGFAVSLIYLLSPISFLLTGYHSQFDNLAVLVGLISYLIYIESYKPQRYYHSNLLFFVSALVLGVSLSVKHILFLFPLWLLLQAKRNPQELVRHLLYLVLSYTVFVFYFVQEVLLNWSFRAGIVNGINLFVIQYKGSYGVSALLKILSIFFPVEMIDKVFANAPVFKGYMFFFVLLMMLIGYLLSISSLSKKNLLIIYLLSFFSLSSSMADQYIAIALVPLAVFFANPVAFFTILISYMYLAGGLSANFGGLINYPLMIGVKSTLAGMFPWNTFYRFENLSAQAWFIALLISVFLGHVLLKHKQANMHHVFVRLGKFAFVMLIFFLNLNLFLLLYTKYFVPNTLKIEVLDTQDDNICADILNQEVIKKCNGEGECIFTFDTPECSNPFYVYWKCTDAKVLYPVHFAYVNPDSGTASINISCKSRLFY